MSHHISPKSLDAQSSKDFWAWVKGQEEEAELWVRDVALSDSDYERVLALLKGCDLLHSISDSEFVVPALLSTVLVPRVDARIYSDADSPYRVSMAYSTLPPGFFDRYTLHCSSSWSKFGSCLWPCCWCRLIVRCRRSFTHMDFSKDCAAFYR